MSNSCLDLKKLKNEQQTQVAILKRMLETGTSAEKLKFFVDKLIKKSSDGETFLHKYANLSGEELIKSLTKDLIKSNEPEHKKYIYRDGRPLPTLDDFNRAGLSRNIRMSIKNDIQTNIVDRCLFDLTKGTGEIKSLEKINENILGYKLEIMLKLGERLGIKDPMVTTVEDVLYHPEGNGEYLLQKFYDQIEELCYGSELLDSDVYYLYNLLKYFDTILLSAFENVIDFDSEYQDDGYIYARKYVYKGPGANMRKGHQDNKTEGYADAWDNMSNMTKMVSNYIPRYATIAGVEVPRGYIGEKMAIYLFAELWDYVMSEYDSPSFNKRDYKDANPQLYIEIKNAVKNPSNADWSVIVNGYIEKRCSFGNINVRECMIGLYKHVFKNGRGTWLYEDFVSCIQKYRKTSYGIISKVRSSENKYLEFNELKLWTQQQANFDLQNQIAYSVFANHTRYNTPEARLEFAKQIGLKAIDTNSFSLKIEGHEIVVTINKKQNAKDTEFKIEIPSELDNEDILKFLSVNMGINISKDALLMFQSQLHTEEEGRSRGAGGVIVTKTSDMYFRQSIAPIFALWVNSVFDTPITIDGKQFQPYISFEKRYFGSDQLKINNFRDYFTQLGHMASILQIVHRENTSNVIKNGKGNNVPTTQLTTIQQDGPMLRDSIARSEKDVQKETEAKFGEIFRKSTKNKDNLTQGFKSISAHNIVLSQSGFCATDPLISAGIVNGSIAKESKELKCGELTHDEIMYLFAQPYFAESKAIYSQATANADKNLQALRSMSLGDQITYTNELGDKMSQNQTLRSMIYHSMRGDDSQTFAFYRRHNAQVTLALENNICHAYNCVFAEDPDWEFVNDIEQLMSQLIRLRHKYLQLPAKVKGQIQRGEIEGNDWTLDSVKKHFRKAGVDFNESTFGISAEVKGVLTSDPLVTFRAFECVQIPKDLVRDIQIAKAASEGNYKLLQEQSFAYEKSFIEDLIDEICDINIITDSYFKHLVEHEQDIKINEWVTESGDMILAKFSDGIREHNLTIYSSADDVAKFKKLPASRVTINPVLHAYHNIQFTVNTQMNEAYNGSRFSIGAKKDNGVYIKDLKNFEIITKETSKLSETDPERWPKERVNEYNDKLKNIKDEWEENYYVVENLRMVDYYKRATVNGTREHRLLYGGKYDIPEKVYQATFEDPEGFAYLSSNIAAKCKAQDGSIWSMPWHARQIDVGAGEAKLPPGVRKTMYHDIDPVTGGAMLLKMAEYPITNAIRRLSMDDKMNMEILFMKLANRKQIRLNENKGETQLGIGTLSDYFRGEVLYEQQMYDMTAEDFGEYYAFTIGFRIEGGRLIISKKKWRVDKNGNGSQDNATVKDYPVDTLYQIDRLLGGAYSQDLTQHGLVEGEAQNNYVNKIICELDLKDNYIAYATNKESVKNNIKNVNSSKEWYDTGEFVENDFEKMGKESKLWTNRFSTKFGGIILNALHEMDEDVDVARGVQMLSEMIQNGYLYDNVQDIFNNVRLGIQDALKKYTEALALKEKNALQEIIFDTLVDSLTNGRDKTKVSLAQEFVLGIKAARDEKRISISAFPISDKALYDLLITTIVGKINKEGIRARNSGFGGVKHPSYGVAKIYDIWVPNGFDKEGNPKFIKCYATHKNVLDMILKFKKSKEGQSDLYKNWTPKMLFYDIVDENGVLNPFIERSRISIDDINVDLGETIIYRKDGKWVSFEISSDKEYQYFKRYIEPNINTDAIYRHVFKGRRLRGYRTSCTYVTESGETKHDLMFNMDEHYLISSVSYVKEAFKKIMKIMRNEDLWDPHKDEEEQVLAFIKTDSGEARNSFIKHCKNITGYNFRDDFTIDDLEKRIAFVDYYLRHSENFDKMFRQKYGKGYVEWVKTEHAGDFNVFLSKDKSFNNLLEQFLRKERLIGVSRFTDEKKFKISTATVDENNNVTFTTEDGNIEHSIIRKAEYMKSKGNVAKQFLIDRGDSMFDILSQGSAYFVNKLRALYTQPNDSNLFYDVAIYDKQRRPTYIKYDPTHAYAKHFSKQGGEYYATKNGAFKEINGSIYYKDVFVCDSNKMTSWIKHGENGEKYNVITVYDENTYHLLLHGKYGRHDGFVHRIVPRLPGVNKKLQKEIEDKNVAILNLQPTEENLEQWREESQDNLSDEEIIANNRWKLGRDKHIRNMNALSHKNLLSYSWYNLNSFSFDKWLRDEAKMMWESFEKQRYAIGTRIPSQAMQSMMALECVGYIDADYNEEMASIEMTYIQGSDYDIDKDYITEYFIDETGFVGDRSKLQQVSAFADYLDELPPPNGSSKAKNIKYAIFTHIDKWDATKWTEEDRKKNHLISFDDAAAICKWIDDPENNMDAFDEFKEILDAVNKGKKIHIQLENANLNLKYLSSSDYKQMLKTISDIFSADEINKIKTWFKKEKDGRATIIDDRAYYAISEYVSKATALGLAVSEPLEHYAGHFNKLREIARHINMHQTSVINTSKNSQNISLTKELEILSNPQNIAAMEISVDLSLDELKEFANEKGVKSKNGLSIWSASSKFKAQDTNLLGKTGVGVAANADKVYFTVYYYHTKVLNETAALWKQSEVNKETEDQTLKNIIKVLTINPFDSEDLRCLSKINWNILKNVPDFNVYRNLKTFDLNEKQASIFKLMLKNATKYRNDNKAEKEVEINEQGLTFKNLLKYLKSIGEDVDGPTLLSALVSAATDNAKELVLSKLNAFGDILDAYGMCASLGIPFEETATIFTSPLLNVCVKEIRGDIFERSDFASKLENSFGMYFATFKAGDNEPKINSILSSATVGRFVKEIKGIDYVSHLRLDLANEKINKTAESWIDELKSNNNSIEEIIKEALPAIKNHFATLGINYDEDWMDSLDDIYDAVEEMYDDSIVQQSVSWENSDIVQKLAFVSFLKKLKLRNNAIIAELHKTYDEEKGEYDVKLGERKIDDLRKQLKDLKSIKESLMPTLYEQQMLHKILGITKGIEGQPQLLYRYIRELEYFVKKKYKKAELEEDFDFIRFFKDETYAREQIAKYDGVREFTNILECLYENEYIGEMLKTVGDVNELLTRVSFVYGNTQKIAKAVESKLELHRPLNVKEYNVIRDLVNEWMIYKFLTYHSPNTGIKIVLDPEREERTYLNGNYRFPEAKPNVLSIDSITDIASFKRLSNLFFFPDLLQDYVEHKGSERFGGENGNMFLEAIVMGGYQRIIPDANKKNFATAVEEMIWKLSYNLNEDIASETSDYALQMKKDFEAVFKLPLRFKNGDGNWVERGITIGDFIYLYNLVAYKNSGTKNSFTKLFENAEEFRKVSTILPWYNAFVAMMDSGITQDQVLVDAGVSEYDFVEDTDFMKSVIVKLAAMKNSKLKDMVVEAGIKHNYTTNPDYPFNFVLQSHVLDDIHAKAAFYDKLTELITQNVVTKTSQRFDIKKPGVYYVQESMLPENPEYFVKGFGDMFVWATPILSGENIIGLQNEKGETIDLKSNEKLIIVTDPQLAAYVKDNYGEYFKQSFIHSEREFVNSKIGDILEDTIVRLPHNTTFITIIENTIEPDTQHVRPMILQDAIRTLWNSSGLASDGYDFEEYVKFETANSVGKYNDHRRFAKAWFEYTSDGNAQVHINIDNCDDANVVLHEMSHVLLLIAKTKNYEKYREIANQFLNEVHKDETTGEVDDIKYADAWKTFKETYPKTIRNEYGEMVQLTEDMLFDEFLINAVSNQTNHKWNLNALIDALRPYSKTKRPERAIRAAKLISDRIADGTYQIKCD